MIDGVDERKLVPELVTREIQRVEPLVLFVNALKIVVENNLLGIWERINTGLEQALVVVARRSKWSRKSKSESFHRDHQNKKSLSTQITWCVCP